MAPPALHRNRIESAGLCLYGHPPPCDLLHLAQVSDMSDTPSDLRSPDRSRSPRRATDERTGEDRTGEDRPATDERRRRSRSPGGHVMMYPDRPGTLGSLMYMWMAVNMTGVGYQQLEVIQLQSDGWELTGAPYSEGSCRMWMRRRRGLRGNPAATFQRNPNST